MAQGRKTGGRKSGTPNKATRIAREAIAQLVECNIERMQRWLDTIEREEGARAAWECFVRLIEYHVPRLARTELSDPNGQSLNFRIMVPPKSGPQGAEG